MGEFKTEIPACAYTFRVIYSGGSKKRKGVAMILRNKAASSVLNYQLVLERIMVARFKADPVNLLVIQAYAPCEDAPEEETEKFYELLDQTVAQNRKGRECLVVMGDLNGKVGSGKEDKIVGPFGRGVRNDNGQEEVDFARRQHFETYSKHMV